MSDDARAARQWFRGQIAGIGSTSGTRVVIGHWTDTPLGEFSDAMVETAAGHRVLLAPHWEASEFIEATYSFDDVRIEPFKAEVVGDTWRVHSTSLDLELTLGRRTGLGLLLRAVPRRVAEAPAWCLVTDPIARVALRGVRTRGTANRQRTEWYGATDSHRITAMTGHFDGADLGGLTPVDPPTRFGFSSTPRRPSVTDVVTTVDLGA